MIKMKEKELFIIIMEIGKWDKKIGKHVLLSKNGEVKTENY